MSELVKPTKQDLIKPADIQLENLFEDNLTQTIDLPKIQTFMSKINQEPPAEFVEINKFAGNTKYLPISYLEMLLDQITLGLWETTDFKFQIITNELVGSLTLKYFNPITSIWINRVGAAAVQIQTNKGTNAYEIANKIPNTLVKQMGQLKAECFRNACKSIGKLFGRDLNRNNEAEFNEAYEGEDLTIKIAAKVQQQLLNTKSAMNNSRGSNDWI